MDQKLAPPVLIPNDTLEPSNPSSNHQALHAYGNHPFSSMPHTGFPIDGNIYALDDGTPTATASTPYHRDESAYDDDASDRTVQNEQSLRPFEQHLGYPAVGLQQGDFGTASSNLGHNTGLHPQVAAGSDQKKPLSNLSSFHEFPAEMEDVTNYVDPRESGHAHQFPNALPMDQISKAPDGTPSASHMHMYQMEQQENTSTPPPSHFIPRLHGFSQPHSTGLHQQDLSSYHPNSLVSYPSRIQASPFDEGPESNQQLAQFLASQTGSHRHQDHGLEGMMMNPYAHGMRGRTSNVPSAFASNSHINQPEFIDPKMASSSFHQSPLASKKRDNRVIEIDDAESSSESSRTRDIYFAQSKRPKLNPSTPGSSAAIDLTMIDDDIEVLPVAPSILKQAKPDNRLVCVGRVTSGFVLASRVPNPGHIPERLEHWPRMKCRIRDAGHDSGLMYIVTDPAANDFGKLDIYTSRFLRKVDVILHEVLKRRLMLDKLGIYLKRRPVSPGEAAGAPFEGIKAHLYLDIYINVPKSIAERVYAEIQRYDVQLASSNSGKIANFATGQADGQVEDIEAWAPPVHGNHTAQSENVERMALNLINSLETSYDLCQISQPPEIISSLMEHQKKGLYFMMERERNPFDSGIDEKLQMWKTAMKDGKPMFYNKALDQYFPKPPEPSRGGILADDMGLGKTLTMLSLIIMTLPKAREHAMRPPTMTRDSANPNLKGTLIVVPKTLLEANWEKQINTHISPDAVKVAKFYGTDRPRSVHELQHADIVLTTYGIIDYDNRSHQVLRNANWFRIVLDEAHSIRVSTTMRAQACFAIEATRRWAITGTPVQNHISDLGSLCTFLRLYPFDHKARFQNYIEQPFRDNDNGVLPRLRIMVDTILIRRTKENLNLPEKIDELVHVDMTQKEQQMYEMLADNTYRQVQQMTKNRTVMARGTMGKFLRQLLMLRMFCAHKQDMLGAEDNKIFKGLTAEDPLCIDDDEEDEDADFKAALDTFAMLRECDHDYCDYCKEKLEIYPEGTEEEFDPEDETVIGYMNACYHVVCRRCISKLAKEIQAGIVGEDKSFYNCKSCDRIVRTNLTDLKRNQVAAFLRRREELRAQPRLAKQLGKYTGPSSKVVYLLGNLKRMRNWNQIHPDSPPHKVVVFTYWSTHLDLIEIALQEEGFKFVRLDGRMGHKQRLASIEKFESDQETIVFVATIGAGGVGLNLTAANFVFIMEPQWNPQAEQQAVDRVHRIGQTRKVRIARLLASDSVEEQIQRMAAKKLELAKLTLTKRLAKIDERQAKMKELSDLFRRR